MPNSAPISSGTAPKNSAASAMRLDFPVDLKVYIY